MSPCGTPSLVHPVGLPSPIRSHRAGCEAKVLVVHILPCACPLPSHTCKHVFGHSKLPQLQKLHALKVKAAAIMSWRFRTATCSIFHPLKALSGLQTQAHLVLTVQWWDLSPTTCMGAMASTDGNTLAGAGPPSHLHPFPSLPTPRLVPEDHPPSSNPPRPPLALLYRCRAGRCCNSTKSAARSDTAALMPMGMLLLFLLFVLPRAVGFGSWAVPRRPLVRRFI